MSDGGIDASVALGCRTLVTNCAALQPQESVLIVSDDYTRDIGELVAEEARMITDDVHHESIAPFTMHGQEPPSSVANAMADVGVVFGLTRYSMAHSQARQTATAAGVRYLSLAEYSLDVLASPALHTDFRALTAQSQWLATLMSDASEIRLTTAAGTDFLCSALGRRGNAAPGWCDGPGSLASPPDAEANVAMLEESSQGTVVVDGSIPCAELGKLDGPIVLTIEAGRVVDICGEHAMVLREIFDRINNPLTRVVAEFGIGLNPLAQLSGSMLEDEGCLGTVHLGIGSNATIGGRNKVPFHLDHVIRQASVTIDGVTVMVDGHLTKE